MTKSFGTVDKNKGMRTNFEPTKKTGFLALLFCLLLAARMVATTTAVATHTKDEKQKDESANVHATHSSTATIAKKQKDKNPTATRAAKATVVPIAGTI